MSSRPASLFAPIIVGQCALVAVAAVHGARALFLVGPPIDIYINDGLLFWIELAILASMFAVYVRAARGTGDLEIEPRALFIALAVVTLLSVLQVPTTSRDV